jgi:hypothetical protein
MPEVVQTVDVAKMINQVRVHVFAADRTQRDGDEWGIFVWCKRGEEGGMGGGDCDVCVCVYVDGWVGVLVCCNFVYRTICTTPGQSEGPDTDNDDSMLHKVL